MRFFSRRAALLALLVLMILSFVLLAQRPEAAPPSSSILGFSWQRAAAEHLLETDFQALPSPEKAREWHRVFTAGPHPAASERNNQLADFIADVWRKQGWEEVTLRRYDVWHSRPRSVT